MKTRHPALRAALLAVVAALCFPLFALSGAADPAGVDPASLVARDGLVMELLPENADLAAGRWYDSEDRDLYATFTGTEWTRNADSVGFRLTATKKVNLNFGIDLLPEGDYTFELSLRPYGLTNADGTPQYFPDEGTYAKYGYEYGVGFAFGPLKAESFPALRGAANVQHQDKNFGSHQNRWIYQPVGGWADYGKTHNYAPLYADNVLLATERITYTVSLQTDAKSGTYVFRENGAVAATYRVPEKEFVPVSASDGKFFVLESFPADVYAVRLYDRALTEDEQMQNALADLAAAAGLDLSGFVAAPEATRHLALSAMAGSSLSEGKEALQGRLDEALRLNVTAWDEAFADSFHVKEGLTLFLSAAGAFGDSAILSGGDLLWYDPAGKTFLSFGGGVWQKTARGVATVQTYADYRAHGHNYGIVLDGRLPDGNFTVDMALAPSGLLAADGSVYVDEASTYGTYHDYGFAFGAAKVLVFPTKRPEGKTGNLEKRWFYQGKGGWDANQHNELLRDSCFTDVAPGTALSYVVRYSSQPVLSSYTVFRDGQTVGAMTIDSQLLIPNEETEGMLRLMYGYPAEFLFVRVYDRALTNTELAQNHFADLVTYYGWDAEFIRSMLGCAVDTSLVYESFREVGFGLSAEEAAAVLQDKLAAVFMEYVGVAARTDGIGIRGVFSLREDALGALEARGAVITCGIEWQGANGNTAVATVYRTGTGILPAFRIGDGTVAMAVEYRYPTVEMLLSVCSFRGFVRVEEGGETVTYRTASSDPALSSVFGLYTRLAETSYASNARIRAVSDRCYLPVSFTVDPAAVAEKDGTFATVAGAMAAAEACIAASDVPVSVTVSLLPGTHLVGETIVFRPEGAPYRLAVVGDDAVVAGWREISGADFAQVPGSAEYVYTFGEAPAFRYLYVNGAIRQPAVSGELYAENGAQYLGVYKNGITFAGGREEKSSDPKLYLAKELFEGFTPEDAGQMEVHIETNWKYYVCHVANVDFGDTSPDGSCVAVWLDPDEYAKVAFVSTMADCYYWVQNGASCLDRGGEYLLSGNTLRYLPAEGETMSSLVFGVPVVETLLYLENAANVTVTGVTFTGCDARSVNGSGHQGEQAGMAHRAQNPQETAVRGKNVTRFTLRDCVFTDLPGDGVWVSGVTNGFTVEGCAFRNVGATAIRVGKGDGIWSEETNATRNVVIRNNEINGAGRLFRECCAVAVGVGAEVEIAYNTIRNCSYSGISVGWSWNSAEWAFGTRWHLYHVAIHHNYITDFMTEMRDGGAIYTLGGNVEKTYTEEFNEVYDNYIVVSKKTGDRRNYFMCLYHDGASSNWYTYDNIIVENPENRKFDGKTGQVYIHLQQAIGATATSTGQAAFNITVDHCYIVNVQSTEEDDILTEVFGGPKRVDESRGLSAVGMEYLASPEDLDDFGLSIIDECGCDSCLPDYNDVLSGNY